MRCPQWCKSYDGLGIETMVWEVPIVPFWLFYYETSLTYVKAYAHYFADTAHGFPQWCKIWAKNWILNYPSVRDCNHGMGGTNGIVLAFLQWMLIDLCASQCILLFHNDAKSELDIENYLSSGIITMVCWVVPMVPFWLFFYESSLTYIEVSKTICPPGG